MHNYIIGKKYQIGGTVNSASNDYFIVFQNFNINWYLWEKSMNYYVFAVLPI